MGREVLNLALRFALTATISTTCAWATDLSDCTFETLLDTAMELELRVKAKTNGEWTREAKTIFGLFTTKDGTLKPILGNTKIRDPLLSQLKALHEPGTPLEAMQWDLLPFELQHELLRTIEANKPRIFSRNRSIAGLQIRDRAVVRFDRPTELFGKTYPANEDITLDLAPVLRDPKVEIGGPEAVHDLSYFEIHLRGNHSTSGKFQDEVWTLLNGLQLSKDRAHVHTVGPADRTAFQRDSDLILQRVEHYRRANLAAEMISIVEKRNPISQVNNPVPGATDWGSLTSDKLDSLERDLKRFAETGQSPRGENDEYKATYVAFHFPTKYDGATPLFGYQFRSVDRKRRDKFSKLLDGAQSSLNQGKYLLSKEDLQKWGGNAGAKPMGSLWYRNPTNDLTFAASPEVKKLLAEQPKILSALDTVKTRHLETGMLTYDWSSDPLFASRPDRQLQIREAQIAALKRVGQGYNPISELRQFLVQSGVYQDIIKSLTTD